MNKVYMSETYLYLKSCMDRLNSIQSTGSPAPELYPKSQDISREVTVTQKSGIEQVLD